MLASFVRTIFCTQRLVLSHNGMYPAPHFGKLYCMMLCCGIRYCGAAEERRVSEGLRRQLQSLQASAQQGAQGLTRLAQVRHMHACMHAIAINCPVISCYMA